MFNENNSEEKTMVSVSLSTYEWHSILLDLEYLMRICNRNNESTYRNYEAIASVLNGGKVVVERPPKPEPVVEPNKSGWGKCKKVLIAHFNKPKIKKVRSHNPPPESGRPSPPPPPPKRSI